MDVVTQGRYDPDFTDDSLSDQPSGHEEFKTIIGNDEQAPKAAGDNVAQSADLSADLEDWVGLPHGFHRSDFDRSSQEDGEHLGGYDCSEFTDLDSGQEDFEAPSRELIECSKAAYLADRDPRYGTSNPERVESDFLQAMVRRGCDAFAARETFDDLDTYAKPVWCFSRFGRSLTRLADGRVVAIGGEHEDSYDPDFYIYNDVIIGDVHNVEIYRYPEDVFPPTDFHSATLVGNQIIIIGSLGYAGRRRCGKTPVYALDLATLAISHIATSGTDPGWISRHKARFIAEENIIEIRRGWICQTSTDCERVFRCHQCLFRLNLNDFCWTTGDEFV